MQSIPRFNDISFSLQNPLRRVFLWVINSQGAISAYTNDYMENCDAQIKKPAIFSVAGFLLPNKACKWLLDLGSNQGPTD